MKNHAAFQWRGAIEQLVLTGAMPVRLITQPAVAVSYTHLRAHETVLDLVCRLLLEKKNIQDTTNSKPVHKANTYVINIYAIYLQYEL